MYRVNYSNNKYNARTSIYNGISYHSRAEAEFAMGLDDDLKNKRIKGWRGQEKIPLNVKYIKGKPIITCEDGLKLKEKSIEFDYIWNYYIDFVVEELDGSETYLEVKGVETELWKKKWKFCECLFKNHPIINLQVVKVGGSWKVRNKKLLKPYKV